LSHRLNTVLDRLYGTSEWERATARKDALLAGLALTGYVEAEELGAPLPLHGPLTDQQEERDRSSRGDLSDGSSLEIPFVPAPGRQGESPQWNRLRA
jgi:hypothetical protein